MINLWMLVATWKIDTRAQAGSHLNFIRNKCIFQLSDLINFFEARY